MARAELVLFRDGADALDPDAFAPGTVLGPDKVAQRVAYALLTPAGSVPGAPELGTDFLGLLNEFASEFDVHAAFAACESQLAASVQAAEDDDDAASEKFGSASLGAVEVSADSVSLRLLVTAADGSSPAGEVIVAVPV